MKVDLTKITATVTAAEIYGRDEIEIPDGKRVKHLALVNRGDLFVTIAQTPSVAECSERLGNLRLVLEDVPPPMRRTITLQATGERRRLIRDEAGLQVNGKLVAFGISTADEYEPLRVISDQEEPER